MKFRVNVAAAAILAASLVVSYAQTGGTTPQPKKHTTTKKKRAAAPSVEDQINALRQEIQSQIDTLKSDLADEGCATEAGAADRHRCAGGGSQGAGRTDGAAAGVHRKHRGRFNTAEHSEGPEGQPDFARRLRSQTRPRASRRRSQARRRCITRASPLASRQLPGG